jgi:hypothetical protein
MSLDPTETTSSDPFSQSPISKYSLQAVTGADQMGMAEQVGHGLVATVVDMGTTLWNSTAGLVGAPDANTADLLSRIDKNALKVYEEHPDAVHTASFFGGMVAPIGLAMKGMNALRAGAKGASWFSEAGRVSRLVEVEKAMTEIGNNTTQLRDATRSVYMASAANALVDNVAMEAAIVLTQNASPLMEDYKKDFGSNFLFSVAIGTGIGAIGGHIISRKEVADVVGKVEGEFTSTIAQIMKAPQEGSHAGGQFQVRAQNIKNIEEHLAVAEDPTAAFTLTDFTKNNLKAIKLVEEARLADDFAKASSEAIQKMEAPVQDYIRNLVKDVRFAGVDSIDYYKVMPIKMGNEPTGLLQKAVELSKEVFNKKGEAKIKGTPHVFSPVFDGFIPTKEAANYSTLADLNTSIEALSKEASSSPISHLPQGDAEILTSVLPTAEVQSYQAKAILALKNRDYEDLVKHPPVAAPNDKAALDAIKLRLDELKLEGYDTGKILTKLISEEPSAKVTSLLADKLAKTEVDAATGDLVKVKQEVITTPFIRTTMEVSHQELSNAIDKASINQIRSLQKQGASIEEIGLRTNIPTAAVEEFLSKSNLKSMSFLENPTSRMTTELDIQEAMRIENRALLISTNLDKVPTSAMKAELNKMQGENLDQNLIEYYTLSSSSKFVQDLGTHWLSEESKAQLLFIGKEIDQIVGSKIGNTLLTSANSFLEKLGPVGQMVTGYGKHIINAKNIAKKEFTTPLAATLAPLVKNPLQLTEFNTAINVQAAASGPRIYKAGQFWQQKGGNASTKKLIEASDEEFLTWATSSVKRGGVEVENAVPLKFKGSEYKVVDKGVDAALKQMQAAGRELYELKNVSYKAAGKGELSDLGFWVPANNPRGKQIAYAFNKRTHETTMLLAHSPAELNTGIEAFKKTLGLDANFVDVVTKDKQKYYNQLKGRHDPMYMAVADLSKQHGGASALSQVSLSSSFVADLVQGYDHYIDKGIDDIAQMQLGRIFGQLDNLSEVAAIGYSKDSLNKVQQMMYSPKDTGQIVKNVLLGRSNIDQHEWWGNIQTGLQTVSDTSLQHLSDIAAPLLKKNRRTEEDWRQLSVEMEAKGIVNPFQVFEEYLNKEGKVDTRHVTDLAGGAAAYIAVGKTTTSDLTSRGIALTNAIAATTVLRFGDIAHGIVNVLSLPILTSAALNRTLAKSYMGTELDSMAKFSLASSMLDGVRLMNHPIYGEHYGKLAAKANLLEPDWMEMNALMRDIRSVEGGISNKAYDILESNFVKMIMSRVADKSEVGVRTSSFFTAVAMARKAYPGISDAGIMTFARDFMDTAVGNYAAAQRPAIFQGTLGMAMGLFQTYMLTYAQNMYRQIENRQFKQLGKMMLAQSTIFGAASLPGFHPISEAIGEHFSDNHFDLETGTFNALPNMQASILLYGLPSQLVGLNTRGDIQPRIPNPLQGFSTLAAVNLTEQAYTAGEKVVRAAFQADANTGKAMLEALSLQSISRPVARISELLAGHSITSTGDIVANNLTMNPMNENFTIQGAMARVMATRPIEEIKAREALHLKTLYSTIDSDARKKVTFRLKSYIQNGTLTEDKLSELGEIYMRTGSPTGWRSAINHAIAMSQQSGAATTLDKLGPDSPTMKMIDDLDGAE